jgi:glycosyltransferase involved in cell wall biosynthesis
MIKVLYIIACLKTGGSEVYLLNLVKNLDRERFQVTVWCEGDWGPTGDKLRSAGATVIQRPCRPKRPDHVLGAIRYIRRNRFDIVHSLKYGAIFMDAVITKTARVGVFISSRRNLPHWINQVKMHNGERLRNKLTNHIIANSKAVKDLTIAVEHVKPTKISVIYTGINLEEVDAAINNSRPSFRSSLGIPDDAMIIGNMADLREVKGQSYLVRAFAEAVRKTSKDIYLVIKGEGQEESNLRSLVKELKLEDRVKICTSPGDSCEVMRSFDVFVLPSLTERFPNRLIEAMALSLPCIASDVGGIPEAVIHNVSGLIVPIRSIEPLTEAILRLVEDPALVKDFGAKGRELVEERFTVQMMAAAHERLYEELLGRK